jgi:hypothetical protein
MALSRDSGSDDGTKEKRILGALSILMGVPALASSFDAG